MSKIIPVKPEVPSLVPPLPVKIIPDTLRTDSDNEELADKDLNSFINSFKSNKMSISFNNNSASDHDSVHITINEDLINDSPDFDFSKDPTSNKKAHDHALSLSIGNQTTDDVVVVGKERPNIESFTCPLTLSIMCEPVIARDGNTYE